MVATRSFGQVGSRKAEKSISAASAWRSGSRSNGSNRAEDNPRPKVTEVPAGENPPINISERNDASSVILRQKRRSRIRAPSRPPSTKPDARSTPLTAPALAPLMASMSQSSSSSSRSRTPQVNAPNEPPPCKAKDSRRGGQVRLSAKRRFCQALFCQMLPSFGASAGTGPCRSFSVAICSAGLLRGAGASACVDQISAADGRPPASIRMDGRCILRGATGFRLSCAPGGSTPLIFMQPHYANSDRQNDTPRKCLPVGSALMNRRP